MGERNIFTVAGRRESRAGFCMEMSRQFHITDAHGLAVLNLLILIAQFSKLCSVSYASGKTVRVLKTDNYSFNAMAFRLFVLLSLVSIISKFLAWNYEIFF